MKQKRNTIQKGIVFDAFYGMRNHPSAGMVYEKVHEEHPEISKATVYRLLAEAAEEGAIQRLKLNDVNDRYDFTLGRHYHIICRACGAVADVVTDMSEEKVLMQTRGCEDFSVEDIHVEFSGLCKKCLEINKN